MIQSRKFRLCLISLLALVAGFAISSLLKIDNAGFSTFATTVVALFTSYAAGNVTNKWVIGKTSTKLEQTASSKEKVEE